MSRVEVKSCASRDSVCLVYRCERKSASCHKPTVMVWWYPNRKSKIEIHHIVYTTKECWTSEYFHIYVWIIFVSFSILGIVYIPTIFSYPTFGNVFESNFCFHAVDFIFHNNDSFIFHLQVFWHLYGIHVSIDQNYQPSIFYNHLSVQCYICWKFDRKHFIDVVSVVKNQ